VVLHLRESVSFTPAGRQSDNPRGAGISRRGGGHAPDPSYYYPRWLGL